MSQTHTGVRHVAWAKAANIYEVNVRQFTPEGSFEAFAQHLPRLKAMGVDIVWLMPINPIGRLHRKGTMGSAYSVSDYRAINPEFGTLAEFKQLVDAVHAQGMKLIIDWVANHTAWDHAWVSERPEWYKKNAQGQIDSYAYDNGREVEHWTDVVGLDYTQAALWEAMTEALLYWVKEADIDGYRCDVAGLLPTPFWEQARVALEAIKPVFMLAEWSEPELHHAAFDMSYDWELYDAMTQIASGQADANALVAYLKTRQTRYPKDAYRMAFTSNHDKNAWEGSDTEKYGEAFKVFAVLACTLPGMPLLYGGQEAELDRRLAFFEKDPIDWKDLSLQGFYTELFALKHDNRCLWNGEDGADIELLPCCSDTLFAFRRSLPDNTVTVVANLSRQAQQADLGDLGDGRPLHLPAWGYRIHVQ